MKLPQLALTVTFLALLVSCGPGPEPVEMEGEDQAPVVVRRFMRALEVGDYERAEEVLYQKTDYLLKDLEHCRELFFTRKPTGMSTMLVGHENYGGKWHLHVDLKVSYGSQMKMLRFTLVEGVSPKLRALNPITP